MDIHQVEVAVNHKGLGASAVDHFVSGNRGIRCVALLLGIRFKDVHHAAHKTCGTADLDTVLLKLLCHFRNMGQQGGVLTQAIELHWDKVCEHPIHISLIRITSVYGFPTLPDFRNPGQFLDVQILAKPHRPSCLGHADFHALLLEDRNEHHRRRDHISVRGGSTPVQHQPLDPATVTPGEPVIRLNTHTIAPLRWEWMEGLTLAKRPEAKKR